MGDCIKCLVRNAMPGSSLCCQCSGGIDFRSFDEGLTFEQYHGQFLEKVSDVQGVVRADDELMLYELFKEYEFFAPNLKRVNGTYKGEYAKLGIWFSNRFFTVLNNRIITIDPNLDYNIYFNNIKQNFLQFRDTIYKTNLELSREFKYIGTADINPLILFLKKILRNIHNRYAQKSDFNFADYVDVAGNVFIPGSAMFFLELFSLLKDKNLLEMLLKEVEKIGPDNAHHFINEPLVLLIPWDHQLEGFETLFLV